MIHAAVVAALAAGTTSRNKLAKQTGISRASIANWVAGRAKLGEVNLMKVCAALGLVVVPRSAVAPAVYPSGRTAEELKEWGEIVARSCLEDGADVAAAVRSSLANSDVAADGPEAAAVMAAAMAVARAAAPQVAPAAPAAPVAQAPAAPAAPAPYASGWTLAELQEWGAGVAQQAIADGEDVAAAVRQSLAAADLAVDGPEAAAVLAAARAAQGGA